MWICGWVGIKISKNVGIARSAHTLIGAQPMSAAFSLRTRIPDFRGLPCVSALVLFGSGAKCTLWCWIVVPKNDIHFRASSVKSDETKPNWPPTPPNRPTTHPPPHAGISTSVSLYVGPSSWSSSLLGIVIFPDPAAHLHSALPNTQKASLQRVPFVATHIRSVSTATENGLHRTLHPNLSSSTLHRVKVPQSAIVWLCAFTFEKSSLKEKKQKIKKRKKKMLKFQSDPIVIVFF